MQVLARRPPRLPPAPCLSLRTVATARPPPPRAIKRPGGTRGVLASLAPCAPSRSGEVCVRLRVVSSTGAGDERGALAIRVARPGRSGPGGSAAPHSRRAFPTGRIPGRDGVDVGARAAGCAGQRSGGARLPGEQLPSKGELRQGSSRYRAAAPGHLTPTLPAFPQPRCPPCTADTKPALMSFAVLRDLVRHGQEGP